MFGSDQWMYSSGADFYEHPIEQSLRFNNDDSAYLSRTPSSAGNRQIFTISYWLKRGNFTSNQGVFGAESSGDRVVVGFGYGGTDELRFYGPTTDITSAALLRDTSAWYHIVWEVDTTQATASDRIKLYVNGELITNLSRSTYPAQNYQYSVNNSVGHYLGRWAAYNGEYFDGYLAEFHLIDGQALDATSFGEEISGVWKPIEYTGSYGTNGFYLDFGNSGSIGTDVSGNGNDWTPTNFAATDVVLDSPTNNFATLNPLDDEFTTSEGNLKATQATTNFYNGRSTFAVSSGKWYFESVIQAVGGNTIGAFGVRKPSHVIGSGYIGNDTGDYGINTDASGYYKNNGSGNTAVSSSPTPAAGDIVQCALDMDNGKIWFGVNNTWLESGNPSTATSPMYTGLSGDLSPALSLYNSFTWVANFGQDSSFAGNKTAQGNTDDNGYGDFYYAPPSGYLALCTANLEVPDAMNPALDASPQDYFNTVLYTGNGTTNAITGVGFQPDLLWIKARSSAYHHNLYDAVRGLSAGTLISSATNAEDSVQRIATLDADGFTTSSTSYSYTNSSGTTYAAWNWKANGSGVSNTDGDITSTVSANTDAGFSIVSYTGNGTADSTIGHGLSSAPEMIIVKETSEARGWAVYHETLGYTKEVYLNYTQAATTSNFWRSAPTATTFAVSSSNYVNSNTQDYIAYCFHSVEGFSKFGSYTGNGSTDGPFVYCGFSPSFVMVKRTNSTGSWVMLDTTRDPINPLDEDLYADSSSAAVTTTRADATSNGFKVVSSTVYVNASGGTYIYMAFAENPFKYSTAR